MTQRAEQIKAVRIYLMTSECMKKMLVSCGSENKSYRQALSECERNDKNFNNKKTQREQTIAIIAVQSGKKKIMRTTAPRKVYGGE